MLYKGVDLLTLSKVIEDKRELYHAEKPVEIPVASIDLPEEGAFTPVYRDGHTVNAYPIGYEQSIKIETTAISPEELNRILNGGESTVYIDAGLNSVNYYALGFRLKLYDGSYDYYSYLKGYITVNSKNVETEQGTSAVVESINYTPLVTSHVFIYNNKPCRKLVANSLKHGVLESGWRAIQWTPDNFLPIAQPIINIEPQEGRAIVSLMAVNPNNTVHYTLDGTTPTAESAIAESTIVVEPGTVIRAVECTTCLRSGAVATAIATAEIFNIGYDDFIIGYDDFIIGLMI